ncbi:MAG: hypothetical protein ACI9GY_000711 [Brevundimonas sp.]|jgi:hypothetical protein
MTFEFDLESEVDIEFLNEAFPDVEFSLHRAKIGENSFLTVFSCWVENEELLEMFWSRINNLIGTEYQTKLQDEFSSWNIYLAFFIPAEVSNALKYNIENETFFMRKVVFDSKEKALDKVNISTYLNNHILGKDIRIEQRSNQEADDDESSYSFVTQKLLADKLPMSKARDDKELREKWLTKVISEVNIDEV